MIKTNEVDVLVHVEDPGAINFFKFLPEIFNERKITYLFICDGAASNFFKDEEYNFKIHSNSADEIISSIKPSILMVGTSENKNTFAFDLIVAARKANIYSIAFIDMWCNAKNRFKGTKKDPLFFAPNELFVSDNKTKQEFIDLGLDNKQILVTGNPIYESALNFRKRNLNLIDKSKENSDLVKISFISEGWDMLDKSASQKNKRYNFAGRNSSDFRTIIIMEELIDSLKRSNLDTITTFRMHPNSYKEDFEPNINEFDHICNSGNPYELILDSDIVVGMSSMLLLEAALIGKPTLSILPDPDELSWMPNNLEGNTHVVQTRDSLDDYWNMQIYKDYQYNSPKWASYYSKEIIIKRIMDIKNIL